jgi:hypothetical protein
MSPPEWSVWFAELKEVYWPCLPPELRVTHRPRQEGEPCEVPDDIWQAVQIIFPDPEAWLYHPIPNLDSRTALETIAAGGADKIRAILQEIGPFLLPDPSEVTPWKEEE